MPLVTLLQALARISVFMEYASFFPPNICSSSILTNINGHQTALTCRHDEAFLPQRKTWWSGARVGSFGSSLLSSGSTRRTPSTLALLPSGGPHNLNESKSIDNGYWLRGSDQFWWVVLAWASHHHRSLTYKLSTGPVPPNHASQATAHALLPHDPPTFSLSI